MASTIWKGYLTFGLISIPIRLFAAARSDKVSFNQLHRECNTRIKMQLWCPSCERVVQRNEIIKGYEYAKDTYVLIEDEDIKKVAPASAQSMEILDFVKVADVDPLYYDASYYAVPDEPGRKPYKLLVETMDSSGYAAIAKLAMHQREYTVLVRPRDHGLTLHTMYYAAEVREVEGYGDPGEIKVTKAEVELAKKLVESLATEFQPEKYSDVYQARLREMVEAKKKGEEVATTDQPKLAPVIDLMDALKKSLAKSGKKPPAMESEKKAAKTTRKRPKVRAAR